MKGAAGAGCRSCRELPRRNVPVVVQRDKKAAARYLYRHRDDVHVGNFLSELGLETGRTLRRITPKVDKNSVERFVNDAGLPASHRRELLNAWNTGQRKNGKIKPPVEFRQKVADLTTMKTDTFEGYDSDTEDVNMNVRGSIDKVATERVTLVRQNGDIVEDVPVLGLADAWRFGRQIVKRSRILKDYQACLPIITAVGGRWIEYNSPGTLDIYAYPLVESAAPREESDTAAVSERKGKRTAPQSSDVVPPDSVPEPPTKRRKLARSGGMKDHAWKGIAEALSQEKDEKASFKDTNERIFDAFHGKIPSEATPAEAVAIAAIGSDLMKGVSGGMYYVDKAREKTAESFGVLFTGRRPIYRPSAELGRSKVSERNRRLKPSGNGPRTRASQDTAMMVEEPGTPARVVLGDEEKKAETT